MPPRLVEAAWGYRYCIVSYALCLFVVATVTSEGLPSSYHRFGTPVLFRVRRTPTFF